MRTPEFMIDTANLDDIERVWEKLNKAGVFATSVRGITTNPNALDKINCHTIREFETTIYKLTRFLTRIGAKDATVHVQMPQSNMSTNELEMWIDYIKQLGDGRTGLTLKVSPYVPTLTQLQVIQGFQLIPINVTGISDATTALRCLTYPVAYVSIIPGRMEEVGIDAVSHLKILDQRFSLNDRIVGGKIITGSMRTIDGLLRAIFLKTVPTIGTRVWDAMTDEQYKQFADSWWNLPSDLVPDYLADIPLIDQRNIDLTRQFFAQMDTLGKPLYDEFVNKQCK